MPAWRTRPANQGDLHALLSLHRELYLTHRDKILNPQVIRLIDYHNFDRVLNDDMKFLLGHRDARVLIAEETTTLVGYITGRVVVEEQRLLRKKGVIEDWYVQEKARGQGIGQALLLEMQSLFRKESCEVVEATTWSANARARALYAADNWLEIQVLLRKEIKP